MALNCVKTQITVYLEMIVVVSVVMGFVLLSVNPLIHPLALNSINLIAKYNGLSVNPKVSKSRLVFTTVPL